MLAEIGAVVQLLQQHQLRAGFSGLRDTGFDQCQIGGGIALIAFLHQGDGECAGIRHGKSLLSGFAW